MPNLPQVGDYVRTPFGPGVVVGFAVYVLDRHGWVWNGRSVDHGPYVIHLDDGREEGFQFDHLEVRQMGSQSAVREARKNSNIDQPTGAVLIITCAEGEGYSGPARELINRYGDVASAQRDLARYESQRPRWVEQVELYEFRERWSNPKEGRR